MGVPPTAGTDYKGKFQSKMEDDWGYPYFRKPLFQGIREKQCDQCPGPLLVDDSLGDFTTQQTGEESKNGESRFHPTRIQWNQREILNTAHVVDLSVNHML